MEAYEADPNAFGKMISDLDNSDIQRLGAQIAYAVENDLVEVTLPTAQNGFEASALSVIQQAIAQADPPQRSNVGTEKDTSFPIPLDLLICLLLGIFLIATVWRLAKRSRSR